MPRIHPLSLTPLPAVVLLVSAGIAHAATRSMVMPFAPGGESHVAARVLHRLPARMDSSARYVYAEDGTCPDGIDVVQAADKELSFLQHVQTGCAQVEGYANLAVVRTPADCLVYSETGDQAVVSFTIDASTGLLSSAPVSRVDVGLIPGDLAVSGSMVFASITHSSGPFSIDVLTVGAGCSLTLDSQNTDEGDEYTDDIAVANPSTVVSCDEEHGQMLAYTLQGNDTLVQTVASPDDFCGGAGMVAANASADTLVFTGGGGPLAPRLRGSPLMGASSRHCPVARRRARIKAPSLPGLAYRCRTVCSCRARAPGKTGEAISAGTRWRGAACGTTVATPHCRRTSPIRPS